MLLNSLDGGFSWNQILINNNKDLKSIFFINEQKGWIGAENLILKTIDNGNTWDSIQISLSVNDICFLNENKGFVVGESGKIAFSKDGGNTWVFINHNYSYASFNSIYFINENIGWICGKITINYVETSEDKAVILSTNDAGETWTSAIKINQPHP